MPETPSPTSTYQPFLLFLTLALVAVALYFAQQVFIPVALAILLAFVLTPVVSWLEHRGLPRTAAVAAAVLFAAVILLVVGLTITWQLRSLAAQAPDFEKNIAAKLQAARDATRGTFLENFQQFARKAGRQLEGGASPAPPAESRTVATEGASTVGLLGSPSGAGPLLAASTLYVRRLGAPAAPRPAPARQPTAILGELQAAVRVAIELLADGVFAVVLVVFMLVGREDLRNRVVRLLGPGQLVSTTRALDDSARRLSRYLLMQSCTNATVGLLLAVGLYFMGVPYFLLWGFMAFVLRFIPYAGTWSVAALLALFCFANSSGWLQPALAFGYFALLEIVMSQVVEPLLFGHTTGVSPVALVIAIAFWTWLWGPVGLMLAIPLTTCLAVLGKYLPQLEFLAVLLGAEPVLDEPTRFYQRLLARDQDEATELAEDYVAKHDPAALFDRLLLPALVEAKRDHERGELPLEDEQFVFEVTRSLLEDLDARQEGPAIAADRARVPVLGCPARDKADELALEMFRQQLAAAGYRVEVLSARALSAEVLARVRAEKPPVVCVAAVPPGGLAQALYLTKRLRRQAAGVKIAVGLWGQPELPARVAERLKKAGADLVATDLLESRNQVVPLVQTAAAAAPADGKQLAAAK